MATIEFSAQFGGRDAAAAVLSHFKALKLVARSEQLSNFPYRSIAFVLRVDGKVNSYKLSGPGNLDIYGENYVSVDIGIRCEDYEKGSQKLANMISGAIRDSVDFIRRSSHSRLKSIELDDLQSTINRLCNRYEKMFTDEENERTQS